MEMVVTIMISSQCDVTMCTGALQHVSDNRYAIISIVITRTTLAPLSPTMEPLRRCTLSLTWASPAPKGSYHGSVLPIY